MRSAIDSGEEEAHHSALEVVTDHVGVVGGQYPETHAADELSLSLVGQAGIRHTNIPILTCAFMAALTTGATSYSFGEWIDGEAESYPLTLHADYLFSRCTEFKITQGCMQQS
jgi:hypothetical protein